MCGITAVPPSRDIHKTALGADQPVRWCHYATTPECLAQLRAVRAADRAVGSSCLLRAGCFADARGRLFCAVNAVCKTSGQFSFEERMGCGSGACAAVAAAVRCGRCAVGHTVTVKLDGGEAKVLCAADGRLFLSGPACCVFDGTAELDDAKFKNTTE